MQQLPSESIPQSSTPLDDTVTGTSPAAGGDDAPANAPQPLSAASVKPESDLSSVPAAEVLQAQRDTVTLAPLAADAPYIYDSLDDQTFHRTLSDFVQQAQAQYAEFGLTLYYRILPSLHDAQRRFAEHRDEPDYRLDGCAGIEQYVKKLGLTPARVRKWRQRDKERQFTREIKLLAGGSTTCPERGRGKGHAPSGPHYHSELTALQDSVVQALMGQGYKKKDAVAMVKAGEGNGFELLFRSALSRRAIGGAGMNAESVEKPATQVIPEDAVGSDKEPAPEGTSDDDKGRGQPPHAETANELKAALENEPDCNVASKLLTDHIQTVAGQFANERIRIMHVSVRVEFAGRDRRVMPGDFLEILKALPSGSSASLLGKCTRIGGDGQSMVIDWDDTLGQWGSEHGIGGEGENSYRVVTEPRARKIAPSAFDSKGKGKKKRLDALETYDALSGKPSAELEQLIANPKSHAYALRTLRAVLTASLDAEASR